ncbi:MAG: OsmC family protein [Gammaproteobacteria bacterium]
MKIKLKPIVRYKLVGTAESHSLTLLKTRDLVDVSDEPVSRGGTNEGFAPTEFLMAGLAACTNVISHKIAGQNGFRIEEMEIEVDADFNQLGVNLLEEVEVPFPEMRLRITITTTASEEQVEILKRDLPRFCAVSKVIRQSGTRIIEQWTVNRS